MFKIDKIKAIFSILFLAICLLSIETSIVSVIFGDSELYTSINFFMLLATISIVIFYFLNKSSKKSMSIIGIGRLSICWAVISFISYTFCYFQDWTFAIGSMSIMFNKAVAIYLILNFPNEKLNCFNICLIRFSIGVIVLSSILVFIPSNEYIDLIIISTNFILGLLLIKPDVNKNEYVK